MSGFYVLALLAIWALLTKWLWKGGRRLLDSKFCNRWVRVGVVVAVAVFWLGGTFWEVAGKKMYWDARVRKLCAIDGRIKVYETVALSSEKFNRWGQPNFYRPDQGENALGAEYVFKWEMSYLKKGNPSLQRSHTQIFRRDDHKLLGEVIDYSRGGGDLPGPWHPSAFTCPEGAGHIVLLTKIFLKSEKE